MSQSKTSLKLHDFHSGPVQHLRASIR
jgi:hypothetical protein